MNNINLEQMQSEQGPKSLYVTVEFHCGNNETYMGNLTLESNQEEVNLFGLLKAADCSGVNNPVMNIYEEDQSDPRHTMVVNWKNFGIAYTDNKLIVKNDSELEEFAMDVVKSNWTIKITPRGKLFVNICMQFEII